MNLGIYIEGNTPVHNLPAKFKVALLGVLGIGVFLYDSLLFIAACSGICFAGYLLARIKLRTAYIYVKFTFLLAIMLLVFNGIFLSFEASLIISLRLMLLVFAATLMTFTTKISDMTEAIEFYLSPLKIIGFNPAKAGFMVSVCIRFIPVIFNTLNEIKEAHIARHLNPYSLRGMKYMLIPLIIRTLKTADDLSEAMTARCYE